MHTQMEFRRIIEVQHKEFDASALEKSWGWLQDPELKRLTMAPDIDKESQRKWFENLKTRKDYYVFCTWHGDKPVGIGGLKHITEKDAELFGYIGDKYYWGKAVAIDMKNYCLDVAKNRFNLESVYTILLKNNTASYKILKRFGYEIEKDIDSDKMMMRLYL